MLLTKSASLPLNFGNHIRQLKRYPLKSTNSLAELLAFRRIGQSHFKHTTRSTHTHSSHRQTRAIQPGVCQIKTSMYVAKNLRTRQTAIGEGQDTVLVSTMRYRLVARQNIEPWCSAVYQKTTDCLLYTSPSPRDATLSRMPSSA